MITHFTDIVNDLKDFDGKFTSGKLGSKMLRSLSEDWCSLRKLTKNAKDINSYLLEEFYGILMIYELSNA